MADTASGAGSRLEAAEPLKWPVRLGFVARGLTYGIIGALALALALGAGGGATTNQQGALADLASAPLGKVALVAVAVGLLAYALWKLALAATGSGPEGGGGHSTSERLRNLAGAIAYGGFFAVAVGVLSGSRSNQSKQATHTAAGVFGWPGGRWLVGLAGVVFIVVCAVQAYEALNEKFLEEEKTERMSRRQREALSIIGRIGLVSRALVFAIVGYFLVRSAIDFNPHKAVSVDGALRRVAHQPYGAWLLGLIAAGLVTFAIFSFAEARYRRL
jgi:TRAP-type C4-dicarboxylate transport system permease small subunit